MQLEYFVSRIGGVSNSDKHLLVEKPWISDKSPEFPIEIEINLRQKSEIEKIEIVANNKFIPKQIAIFSGNSDDDYIGEVKFKSRKSEDQKYELKNIFLDEKCSKLILSVSEAYVDVIDNLDSQVGLVDVKLFGKYLPVDDDEEVPALESDEVDPKVFTPGVAKNLIPDQKYSKELQSMIEAIEKNKQTAVANEDFKLAKSAQLAVRQLKKSTKEMEELEKDKNEAVADEDFQRANDLQDEITALRSNILASIDPKLLDNSMPRYNEIHRPKNLFRENGEIPTKPKLYQPVDLSPTEISADPSTTFLLPPKPQKNARRPSTNDSVSSRRTTSSSIDIPVRPTTTDSETSSRRVTPSPSSTTKRRTSSRRRSSSSGLGTNKFLEKENMIVPAALNRKRSSSVNYDTPELLIDKSTDDVTEEEVLVMVPPDQRTNVRNAISIFGLDTIAKLYSKHFENRKEGIDEIREKMDGFNSEKMSKSFESVNCLMAHLLKEPLFNVYKDVLLLWHHLCTSRLPDLNLEKFIKRVASESADTLAIRVLSSEKRLVSETVHTFRDAMKLPFIGKAYASKLLNSNSKNLKGRAVLIEIIAKLYGVPHDETGMSEKLIAGFATKCIRTSDQQVRTIGKDLMLKTYKNGSKDQVRAELEKFAASDSNNPTYQKIAREIYNFDGSRPKTDKKKKISFML